MIHASRNCRVLLQVAFVRAKISNGVIQYVKLRANLHQTIGNESVVVGGQYEQAIQKDHLM